MCNQSPQDELWFCHSRTAHASATISYICQSVAMRTIRPGTASQSGGGLLGLQVDPPKAGQLRGCPVGHELRHNQLPPIQLPPIVAQRSLYVRHLLRRQRSLHSVQRRLSTEHYPSIIRSQMQQASLKHWRSIQNKRAELPST